MRLQGLTTDEEFFGRLPEKIFTLVGPSVNDEEKKFYNLDDA
jgi:hypothetical protein